MGLVRRGDLGLVVAGVEGWLPGMRKVSCDVAVLEVWS
jgi:hypothetical protein